MLFRWESKNLLRVSRIWLVSEILESEEYELYEKYGLNRIFHNEDLIFVLFMGSFALDLIRCSCALNASYSLLYRSFVPLS